MIHVYLGVFLGSLLGGGSSLKAFDFSSPTSGSSQPIQLDAKTGVTCHREQGKCVAQGDVWVRRGDTVLRADRVTAYFSPGAEQNTEIQKIEAQGRVHIYSESSPREAFADYAVYQAADESVRLTGHALHLRLDKTFIYADKFLEYRQGMQTALAEGNATAIQGDKLLQAERLIAHLKETPLHKTELHKIEAQGQVVISTPLEYAEGDEGEYQANKQLAILRGHVRITRCEGQISGPVAHVNWKTGESQMLTQQQEGVAPQRVKVVFLPQNDQK